MEQVEQSGRLTDRRSFLVKGAAVGAGTIGAGRLLTAPPASASGGLTKGDAAILQFLAAAELLEADLWKQYNELGGIQDSEVPGGSGNSGLHQRRSRSWTRTCPSTSTTTPTTSRATRSFINAYLAAHGAETGQPGQVPHAAQQQGDGRATDRPADQPDGADHRHQLLDAVPQRLAEPRPRRHSPAGRPRPRRRQVPGDPAQRRRPAPRRASAGDRKHGRLPLRHDRTGRHQPLRRARPAGHDSEVLRDPAQHRPARRSCTSRPGRTKPATLRR